MARLAQVTRVTMFLYLAIQGGMLIAHNTTRQHFTLGLLRLSDHAGINVYWPHWETVRVLLGVLHLMGLYSLLLNVSIGRYCAILGVILKALFCIQCTQDDAIWLLIVLFLLIRMKENKPEAEEKQKVKVKVT